MLHFGENKDDTPVTTVTSLMPEVLFSIVLNREKRILDHWQNKLKSPTPSCPDTLWFFWNWPVRLEQPKEQVL